MPLVRVPVEVAVTCVNKSWHSNRVKKQTLHYVIGFFQRKTTGGAVIKVLANNKPETIHQAIIASVAQGAILYCEYKGIPDTLDDLYEIYEIPEGRKVDGDVHVNNVNNMWRDLKRNIKREHHSVSFQHLGGYCAEVAWRINHAHLTPSQRFEAVLAGVNMKRTTYSEIQADAKKRKSVGEGAKKSTLQDVVK